MKKSILLSVFFLIIMSCGNDSDKGPDEIFYGEYTCERCNMIISEKPFAAQYKTPDGITKKFDDLGCMLEHIIKSEKHGYKKLSVYVVDYSSGKWIDAKTSSYVLTESVNTPMGHGILAFQSRESAEEFAGKKNGRIFERFEQVRDFISGGISSD